MTYRTRFAPSPTGALHIGGVRTALYAYLAARQHGGVFVLRIEDTDQTRYVEGAEDYIKEALQWCGLSPDEGPDAGGEYGPYRQSERRDIYGEYATRLVENGYGYYAFDSSETLDRLRAEAEAEGKTFRYDGSVREGLDNSLKLTKKQTRERLDSGEPYTVRLKVPRDEQITIHDRVRGDVTFRTNELDDKIMLKADGMPTYHLANVVDDRLMRITNVIRGEEWLPSTAHHVLLYRAFGWEEEMPEFAHLPLILKPNGKGKLSKRDGAKFGFPVFPLAWEADTPEDSFQGFRDAGYDPRALVNFLAFLGWNPGTEQEIFSLGELVESFSLDQVSKGGARFDIDKARWFNQQYLIASDNGQIAERLQPILMETLRSNGTEVSAGERTLSAPTGTIDLEKFAELYKERVYTYGEFYEQGYYCFEPIREYEEKMVRKRWKPERRDAFEQLRQLIGAIDPYTTSAIETQVKEFINDQGLKFGEVLPMLRIAVTGTMKGPGIFETMELLGRETVDARLTAGYDAFDAVKATT